MATGESFCKLCRNEWQLRYSTWTDQSSISHLLGMQHSDINSCNSCKRFEHIFHMRVLRRNFREDEEEEEMVDEEDEELEDDEQFDGNDAQNCEERKPSLRDQVDELKHNMIYISHQVDFHRWSRLTQTRYAVFAFLHITDSICLCYNRPLPSLWQSLPEAWCRWSLEFQIFRWSVVSKKNFALLQCFLSSPLIGLWNCPWRFWNS